MNKIKGTFQELKIIPSKEFLNEAINQFISTQAGSDFKKDLKEQSYQEGYAKGFQEGQLKKWQEIQVKIELLGQCIERWKEIEKKWIAQVIPGAVSFSIEAIKKITGEMVLSGAVRLTQMLEPALSKIPDETSIVVRMHPLDCNQLDEIKHLLQKEVKGLKVKFEKNDTLPRGSVELNTDLGNYQSTPEIRFNSFINEFIQKLDGSK